MSRRAVTLASAGVLAALLSVVAVLLPVPYVALLPGPTTNTLGTAGKTELIRIAGHRTYADVGHLDLTTVSVLGGPRQRMDLVTALRGWLDGDVAIIPEEQVFPKGQTARQVEQQGDAEMRESQESATTAALRSLDIPVTTRVVVAQVGRSSPASGRLRAGDVLVAVDGTRVDTSTTLRRLITAHRPGERVRFRVARDGTRSDVTVVATRDRAGRTIVGIVPRDAADYPFTVDISLRDVGGPSAGLMFGLGIVDKLTPGSLTGGEYVAGTGTISATGTVGTIGGITQKMIGARRAGATVFLSPPGNCAEASRTVPDGLRLVEAPTLASAVRSLEAIRTDRTATVPACG